MTELGVDIGRHLSATEVWVEDDEEGEKGGVSRKIVHVYTEGIEVLTTFQSDSHVQFTFEELYEIRDVDAKHRLTRLSTEEEWRLFSRFAPVGTQIAGSAVRRAVSGPVLHDTGWRRVEHMDAYRKELM